MTITASFNLQSYSHGTLKALFALLIKLLADHFLSRENINFIIAKLREIEGEMYSRLNNKIIGNKSYPIESLIDQF